MYWRIMTLIDGDFRISSGSAYLPSTFNASRHKEVYVEEDTESQLRS